LRATRPLAHGNIAPAILYGQAIAWATTAHFSWGGFVLAHSFGIVDHLLIVLANDYADRDADVLNTTPTILSGGSRVLPDEELSPGTMRRLAGGAAIALVVLGALAFPIAPAFPLLALAALALIQAYSFAPLRASYRGGGELLQGLGVGVVLPLVGVTAQGAPIDARTIGLLVPSFVLGVAGNVITSIPDADPDRAAEKRSPAARWGVKRARWIAAVMTAAALALGAWLVRGSWLVTIGALAVTVAALAAPPTTRRGVVAGAILLAAAGAVALLGWSAVLAIG
jgi:1,4-dihydroxy-2-naphthoate octaprenyltransferase